jgi:outer membrane lipoprotein-sorting protein
MKKTICLVLLIWSVTAPAQADKDAGQIVRDAFDYMRGVTSTATMEMVIHRPDFTRTMVIRGWTKGDDLGLFNTLSPPRDRGNATLKKGNNMWTFNPKINRVIKLPPSMMSQGWMGSDFSNNDLSKTDSILHDYTHELLETKTDGDLKIYRIRSIPRPGAPVVWGMQILTVRSDYIMLEQRFFDQDEKAVKTLYTEDIQKMDDRLFPKTWIMKKEEETDTYTRITYQELAFNTPLDPGLFSITRLKNLRQ